MNEDWSWVRRWTNLLDQDEVWRDAQGTILRLDDMDPGYCGRVRAFCLRQADAVYDLIGMQAAAAPTDMSESATDAFERAFDDFLDAGDDTAAWLARSPLLVALENRSQGRPARSPRPSLSSVRMPRADADPFGPYEYVEPGDRCHGAEQVCLWGQCTQRASTCRCRCAWCCRGVQTAVELRQRCPGFLAHEDDNDWERCSGRRRSCRCGCPACCGDTADVWGLPVY
ncbi:hypothetical protein [Streptomyces mutabilis]|uniref:Uncharacterized protein n=1 Tax=Streptomyces mutabilis TaxID=67332 RepID=A0A086MRJ0_9ACTN|nr:hypothetical protein [Streptomyces mutabilis]KFG71508.1 hypothetical protein FM21_35240 [Streptomyces mutabilis]